MEFTKAIIMIHKYYSAVIRSTHRPQDRYLLNGRFQTTPEDLALQMGL